MNKMSKSDTDEMVTLNFPRKTEQHVMMAVFRYYQDILRAMDKAKYENTEDDQKAKEERKVICQNLVAVLGKDWYADCARQYFM